MKETTINDLITAGIFYKDAERNVPSEAQIKNMQDLIDNVLNPLVKQFKDLEIVSAYRHYSLNQLYNVYSAGAHNQGRAAAIWWIGENLDIEQSVYEMYKWIVDNIKFNTLDIYDTYIDISYDSRYNYRLVRNFAKMHNQHIESRVVKD